MNRKNLGTVRRDMIIAGESAAFPGCSGNRIHGIIDSEHKKQAEKPQTETGGRQETAGHGQEGIECIR